MPTGRVNVGNVQGEHARALLKGNSADIPHQSLFTGPGEYFCVCEKSCIKPSVALEGGARNLTNRLEWCRSRRRQLTGSLKSNKTGKVGFSKDVGVPDLLLHLCLRLASRGCNSCC